MNAGESADSTASNIGRLAGCLWLVMAAFGLTFVAGAAGVGLDASFALIPLILVPVFLAFLVLVGGRSSLLLAISAAAGFAYAVLGIWNLARVGDFEKANPGSVDYSGHESSATFILLALGIALWSAGAGIRRRRQR